MVNPCIELHAGFWQQRRCEFYAHWKWVGKGYSKRAHAMTRHKCHTFLLEGFIESYSMPVWLCVNQDAVTIEEQRVRPA